MRAVHSGFSLTRLLLPLVHLAGILMGWLLYFALPRSRKVLRDNLRHAGLAKSRCAWWRLWGSSIGESGKMLLESLLLWRRPLPEVVGLVRQCSGWEHVQLAHQAGEGIVFLTPHLGCFEVSSLYYGMSEPITVLYRPARQNWLNPIMIQGRARGHVRLVQPTQRGVRVLLAALKHGEAVGILPDQLPQDGESGAWAPFFGRPAYTMTLVTRLAQKLPVHFIMAFAERLSYGRGYHLYFYPLSRDSVADVTRLNAEIEQVVRRCPAQYLWSYNRYKVKDTLNNLAFH